MGFLGLVLSYYKYSYRIKYLFLKILTRIINAFKETLSSKRLMDIRKKREIVCPGMKVFHLVNYTDACKWHDFKQKTHLHF